MDYIVQKQNFKEIISKCELGDSIVIPKSLVSESPINNEQFELNLRCVELECDLEKEEIGNWNSKITFIPKKSDKPYFGVVHLKNSNSKQQSLKQQNLPIMAEETTGQAAAAAAPVKKPTLSIKKGDKVKLHNGTVGTIVKYSSNKEITLETAPAVVASEGVEAKPAETQMISKDDIAEVATF